MIAFLFAGQGSQRAGMGADLIAASATCREIFEAADEALGFTLSRIMLLGSADELRRTEIAQPALVTLAVAQARFLLERGTLPDFLCGHSLGQYSALVVAGAIDFSDCVRLVRARGRLMQETVPSGQGAMMAIIGLERERVYQACAEAQRFGIVDVACHNAPEQTVISGTVAAVEVVAARCEEEGAGIVELPVSAPFHCRLLAPMVDHFAETLHQFPIKPPTLPVYDNVTALPLGDAEAVRASLIAQIMSPVLFEESLYHMVDAGVNHFVECGPGKSLLAFAKRAIPSATFETFEQRLAVDASLH